MALAALLSAQLLFCKIMVCRNETLAESGRSSFRGQIQEVQLTVHVLRVTAKAAQCLRTIGWNRSSDRTGTITEP